MATTTSNTIDVLNSLLRGELAATETYQQALEKVGSEPSAEQLRQIHREHREAANSLRQLVHACGGRPDQDSGAWGTFAKAAEGVGKLFGNTVALKVLKEGEEHGAKVYEEALRDEELPFPCQKLIRETLLPQTWEHICVLHGFLASM